MTTIEALSLFSSFLGLGLCLFLGIVLYPQRRIAPAGFSTWGMVASFGIWHLLAFLQRFWLASLHKNLMEPVAWGTLAYPMLAIAFLFTLNLLRLAAIHREPYYLGAIGTALVLAVLPLPEPLLTIVPPFFASCFAYSQYTFGLMLSRRSLFALTLGVSAAIYLFLIRMLAAYLQQSLGAVGWLIEIALLLWAGILWLPLYAGITRFLSRRAQLFSDFGRSVILKGSLIFDEAKRMQFFSSELASRFELARVLIAYDGKVEPKDECPLDEVQVLLAYAGARNADVLYVPSMENCEAREILTRYGYNYLFALRYERDLSGLMLVDTRPAAILDDNEEVLQGLVPQISQSLASIKLLEEKIQLEKELVMQENLASVGKVAAAIAHEVKNPLSAIKAITQLMMEDEAVTGTYAQDLEFIVNEVNRLDQSVRQLLGFSKPPASMEERVNLSELIHGTVAALSRQAEPIAVKFETQIAQDVWKDHSNSELIRQIVLNLLLNALQASPHGGTIQVHLDAARRLTIQDQGQGIPADLHEKIFEPFFTTKPKGTGLGLAIVRKNTRLLGGDVELQAPAGGGTRFLVQF